MKMIHNIQLLHLLDGRHWVENEWEVRCSVPGPRGVGKGREKKNPEWRLLNFRMDELDGCVGLAVQV